jgi:hypothetical protein
MLPDKETILNRHIDEHPFQGMNAEEKEIALNAMDEYAERMSAKFGCFLLDRVREGKTSEGNNLYQLFLDQHKDK